MTYTIGDIHVMPIADWWLHHESDDCECRPRIEEYDKGRIVVHRSYDGREMFEQASGLGVIQ